MQGDQWKFELKRLLTHERRQTSRRTSRSQVVSSVLRSVAAISSGSSRRDSSGVSGEGEPVSVVSVASSLLGATPRLTGGGSTGLSGLSTLISGLTRLFSSQSSSAPPAFPVFRLPAAQAYEGALAGPRSAAGDVRYGATSLSERVPASGLSTGSITVQVQAMDSKSFMDHSDAIASAVRKAMLESHSLNGVISDL